MQDFVFPKITVVSQVSKRQKTTSNYFQTPEAEVAPRPRTMGGPPSWDTQLSEFHSTTLERYIYFLDGLVIVW